jgi:uncharacterized protein
MSKTTIEIPAAAIAAICRRYQVRELSLFGSSLRGEAGQASDIDLLVDFVPEAEVGFLALAAMARELSTLLGRKVDLVPKDGLKPLIRASVLAEAEVVFAG